MLVIDLITKKDLESIIPSSSLSDEDIIILADEEMKNPVTVQERSEFGFQPISDQSILHNRANNAIVKFAKELYYARHQFDAGLIEVE